MLELEAAVQRDPTNAELWYELGVKQQENEREGKALQALRRSVELDPSHLPARLALAISYTNDNDRQGTYESITEWINRNDKYREAADAFRARSPVNAYAPMGEKFSNLIQCLIAMATSNVTGEIDADIQIALAVLLNTNEVRVCVGRSSVGRGVMVNIVLSGIRESEGLLHDCAGRKTRCTLLLWSAVFLPPTEVDYHRTGSYTTASVRRWPTAAALKRHSCTTTKLWSSTQAIFVLVSTSVSRV